MQIEFKDFSQSQLFNELKGDEAFDCKHPIKVPIISNEAFDCKHSIEVQISDEAGDNRCPNTTSGMIKLCKPNHLNQTVVA